MLPNAGHNLNLELNAPEWFNIASNWSDRYVGKTTKPVPEPGLGLALTAVAITTLWKLQRQKTA